MDVWRFPMWRECQRTGGSPAASMEQMCPRVRTGRVIFGGRRNFDDLSAHTRQIDGRAVVQPFHFGLEFYNQILPLVERGCRRAVGESHMSCGSGVWSTPYAGLLDSRSLS